MTDSCPTAKRTSYALTTTCGECPWRKDVPTGRFGPETFYRMEPSTWQGLGQPLFACHKTHEGQDAACVGFLLVAGLENLAVRFAVTKGRLDFGKLRASAPLYSSFAEMARANRYNPEHRHTWDEAMERARKRSARTPQSSNDE